MNEMSKERVIRALEGLGLTQVDAQVYIFLAINGPHKEKEIMRILKLQERQVQRSLKNLQNIEIVKTIGEHAAQFSAVPFEEVIDLFIEVKKEQAKTMHESREELLSSWRETIEKKSTTS